MTTRILKINTCEACPFIADAGGSHLFLYRCTMDSNIKLDNSEVFLTIPDECPLPVLNEETPPEESSDEAYESQLEWDELVKSKQSTHERNEFAVARERISWLQRPLSDLEIGLGFGIEHTKRKKEYERELDFLLNRFVVEDGEPVENRKPESYMEISDKLEGLQFDLVEKELEVLKIKLKIKTLLRGLDPKTTHHDRPDAAIKQMEQELMMQKMDTVNDIKIRERIKYLQDYIVRQGKLGVPDLVIYEERRELSNLLNGKYPYEGGK